MAAFDLGNGIVVDERTMDNGERRYKLAAQDGSAYIRTEAGPEVDWQNAHFHKGVVEMYIVQKGWMAFAKQAPSGRKPGTIIIYCEGDMVRSHPEQGHNVFLSPGSVIHTVKYGRKVKNPEKDADWWPTSSAFDAWTKDFTLQELEHILARLR